MRRAHSILATIGLIVIVGFVLAALADAWVTLVLVFLIAAAVGSVIRFVVPRDRREQFLGRLGR